MAKIWAHRGASAYAPENTLEAFQLAIDMKADGIELDVHLSADGEVVVAHDEAVDRVSDGSGLICEMPLCELKKLDFGVRFPKHRGAQIPTLGEVYALIRPTGMTVNVELKTNVYEYEGIERKCAELAAKYGMAGRVIYSSFHFESLGRVKEIDAALPVGLLYAKPLSVEEALSWRADAVHPHFKLMYEDGLLGAFHRANIKVHPWTVNAPEDMRRLAALGADALITDVPDVARRALA